MLNPSTTHLLSFLVLFSLKGYAQVQFPAKAVQSDTIIVSLFGKPVRFAEQIKKKKKRVSESGSDSLLIAWLAERISAESTSGWLPLPGSPPDRFRQIPSILPVRVAKREQYKVSNWFGMRCHPVTRQQQVHNGMDFPQPVGTAVYATADGYVSRVGLQPDGLGLAIQLVHQSGFTTTYGHLSRYEVQPGQQVRRGQQIGRVGQTGITTGPHLHYIIRYKGRAIDPKRYCFLALKK